MKLLTLIFVLLVTGCSTNCNTLRLNSSDVENGKYELGICKKLIGAASTTIPARGSPMYNYYESNVDNYLSYSKELNSCKKQNNSLMFYESGNKVSVNIQCTAKLNLEDMDWGTFEGNKKLYQFKTNAVLQSHK